MFAINANSAFGFTDEEFDVLKGKAKDLIAELNGGKYSPETIIAISRAFGYGLGPDSKELAKVAFIIICFGFDPQTLKLYSETKVIVDISEALKADNLESCREQLEKLSKPSGKLSSLDLHSCFPIPYFDQLDKSKFATTVATVMKCNSYINEVNFSGNDIAISYTGVTAFSEALKVNSSITCLDLSSTRSSDGVAKTFSEALKVNSSVICLILSHNNIGDTGTTALSEALKVNSSMTRLNLCGNRIDDTGATALSEALKVNSSMTRLNLRGNRIDDIGVTAFSEALKVNSSMTCLNLCSNHISDIGTTALSEALKVNSSVICLILSHNNIGDTGTTALSEVLKVNTALSYLILRRNNIGDTGATAFSEALKVNTGLIYIGLVGIIHMGDVEIKFLADALAKNSTIIISPDEGDYVLFIVISLQQGDLNSEFISGM